MKILHVIARFNVGGTATWLANLSEELIRRNHQVIIVSGSVEKNEIEDSRIKLFQFSRIEGLSRSISIIDDLKAIFYLRKLFLEFKPDVINTHTAKAGVIGRIANLLLFSRRFPIIHTIHGHLLVGYFSRLKVWAVITVEKYLSKISTVILFAGEKVAIDCLKVGIATTTPHYVVRPGLKEMNFKKRGRLRSEFEIEDDAVVIGWLARFAKVKRPDRVIALAEKFPNITFLMGGDGDLLDWCSRQSPRNCRQLGWISPETFWPMCDIALLTSENEAVPISLIEAQFASVPALATNAGSTFEVVQNEITGWLVKGDTEALEKQLEIILSRKAWMHLRKNAYEHARREFTVQKQADDHLRVYYEALRIRGAS